MQVQLIKRKADPEQHYIGWWWSKKLDGLRCWWDGGASRGKLKSEVPWANTAKDGRYKVPQVATGLWSRYNHVIHAPNWFLDQLPQGIPLDGELFHEDRQFLFSTVKKQVPDSEAWQLVKYHIFEIPPFSVGGVHCPFYVQYPLLRQYANDRVIVVEQKQITKVFEARDAVNRIVDLGGEGIVIRNPSGLYYQGRSNNLVRWKGIFDGEGKVIGMTAGKGKYHGKIGALIVTVISCDDSAAIGKTFELSGMPDCERVLLDGPSGEEGKRLPPEADGLLIKVGSYVKFRYRCLSNDSKPMEARKVNADASDSP